MSHMGMGQNITTRGPQVLVFGSIYQGKPFGHFGVTAFVTTTATCFFVAFAWLVFMGHKEPPNGSRREKRPVPSAKRHRPRGRPLEGGSRVKAARRSVPGVIQSPLRLGLQPGRLRDEHMAVAQKHVNGPEVNGSKDLRPVEPKLFSFEPRPYVILGWTM